MNSEDEKKRMMQLISLLEGWRYSRYWLHKDVVPIEIYDKHFQELVDLESKNGVVFDNSPTSKIGFEPHIGFHSVFRQTPMLSLDSINSYRELERWDSRLKKKLQIENIKYICEWKIDGLSLSLQYNDHKLIRISTRGDGFKGEDVTFNKTLIKNIPFVLLNIESCEIRGEVFMSKNSFELLNENLIKEKKQVMSSARSAAAGAIQSLIPSSDRSLLFCAYSCFGGKSIKTQEFCLKELQKLGFFVSPSFLCNELSEVDETFKLCTDSRKNINFESDGVVVKVNDYNFHSKVGETSRFPRWAVAYKFPSSFVYTKLISIKIEVSRSGKISYVGEVSPVSLSGSLIKRVTLHNYRFIKQREINIGDELIIKKVGDVIPQLVQVIKLTEGIWSCPTNCPSCDSYLTWDKEKTFQICLSDFCIKKKINYLVHFVSKNGMNILSISHKIVKKFFETGIVKIPQDFYCLDKEKLLKIDGIKEKTADNIIQAVEESKKRPFFCQLSSFSIPGLSKVKSKRLADFFSNMSNFVSSLSNGDLSNIKRLVGPKTCQQIKKFWNEDQNKDIFLFFSSINNLIN